MSDDVADAVHLRTGRRRAEERGTGLLGTTIGVAAMIAMLGFAANVSLGLWRRSTVDAIAYDAARHVATAPAPAPGDPERAAEATALAESEALERADRLLGPLGDEVVLEFEHASGGDVVVLHVRAPGDAVLPRMIHGGPVVGAIDRRIVIRREAAG